MKSHLTRSIFVTLLLCVITPLPKAHAAKTGFIHVEQIDGVWWFIDADGEKFVSLGVNHIEPHLWLAPYNKEATLKRYGSDMVDAEGHFNTHGSSAKKWIDRQVEIIRSLHFNTFGPHTHDSIDPALYRDQVFYIARLNTAPLAGWRERNGEGPRPDVFSPDFRKFVTERVASVCAAHKDSRKLLGYLYTDIPNWVMGKNEQKEQGTDTLIYPWVTAIITLGETSPGKQRWLQLLRERYPSAEAAAEVWGIQISPTYGISWETMARRVNWSAPTDKEMADADMIAFLHLIADQWYGIHREIIHQHDPNHLLLGDKNMFNMRHEWVLPALKKHVDVVAIQTYGLWADDVKITDEVYAATGKPIFNGDGCYSFAAPQQKEWGVKGWRTGAKSIEEVAQFYRATLEGMMATPYVIGWHHCGYLQQWDAAERGDSPMNENGFLDPFETKIQTWTDVIEEVNARATSLHGATGNR